MTSKWGPLATDTSHSCMYDGSTAKNFCSRLSHKSVFVVCRLLIENITASLHYVVTTLILTARITDLDLPVSI